MEKLKEETIKIKEFKRGKSTYIVEIYETEDCTEFWIYNKAYGIKTMMFGIPAKNMTDEEIMEFINSNIKDYIKSYKEDYEDKED